MPNENENFRSLERRIALLELKQSFENCEATPKVQEIIAAAETLLCNENITTESVNTHLRIKMLELDKWNNDDLTRAIVFIQLLLLADYWPLNNDRVEDGTRYYICPLTLEKISGDRVFFKSGYQLDKEYFFDFFITSFTNHVTSTSDFRDPVTRAAITSKEMKYMLGKYPDLGPAVLTSAKYTELKKRKSNAYANRYAKPTLFIYPFLTMLISIILKAFIPAAIMTIAGPVTAIVMVIGMPLVFIAARMIAKAKWKKVVNEIDAILTNPGNAVINTYLQQSQQDIYQKAMSQFVSTNNAVPEILSNPLVNTTATIHQQLNIIIQPRDEKEDSSLLKVPETPSPRGDIASVTEVDREESQLAYYTP